MKTRPLALLALLALFVTLLLAAHPASAFERELYLGKPYLANPLGDGDNAPYTKGPLWRKDGFDCVTYVETLMVDARVKKGADFAETMRKIRYMDGEVDFFSRAHFTESQWIPNAIKYKFISLFPLENTAQSHLTIDIATWFITNATVANSDAAFIHKAKTFQQTTMSIPYVPRKQITDSLLQRMNNIMLVVVLHEFQKPISTAQIGPAVMVTHMGILLNKTHFVHASRQHKAVVSQPLIEYVAQKPKITGIAFYTIEP